MTASLELLHGAKKDAINAELAKGAAGELENDVAAEAPGEDETVDVDVDTMSSKELDELVKANEIEVPETWKKMTVAQKRVWLKSNFGDESEDANAAEATADKQEPTTAAVSNDGILVGPKEVVDAYDNADIVAAVKETADVSTEQAAGVVANVKAETAKGTEVATTKPKKTSKKKDVAIAPKEGEIMGEDPLQDAVHAIENTKKDEALKLVYTLADQAEITFFKLGGILSLIQANGWYAPYPSFREFVEKEHGIQYRKATYWVEIYNRLGQAGVPWAKVKNLGWTKLAVLAKVLTVDNVDEWVGVAEKQNTITLIETVKNSMAKDAPKALEDQSSKTVMTKTFKVHEDQKATIDAALAKAKEQAQTSVDTVALEMICMDYIGGVTIDQKLKTLGLEAAAHALQKAFPEANIDVSIPGLEEEG